MNGECEQTTYTILIRLCIALACSPEGNYNSLFTERTSCGRSVCGADESAGGGGGDDDDRGKETAFFIPSMYLHFAVLFDTSSRGEHKRQGVKERVLS